MGCFWSGKSVHYTWHWKGSIVSTRIRTLECMNYGVNSLPLSYQTCWCMGIKVTHYQVPNTLFTNQSSVRNCHRMTNCEQFLTKCCVKIAATLILATADVFLIRMWQECCNGIESRLSVLKKISVGKWIEILWPSLTCTISKGSHLQPALEGKL